MKEQNIGQNTQGNREHKSSLFNLAFEKKEDKLALYNAINNTNYDNVDELEVDTLSNALYMGVKNDISFLIGHTMNLYEHQSTKNANMPIRGLIYLTKQLENYIAKNKLNVYSTKMQKLPTPKYIVFYNGKSNEPDERIMKLSDAFIKDGGCIECEARLLNINYGHNRELMEKCNRLREYSIFVATVRKYADKKEYDLTQAITLAIQECLQEGILEDILLTQRNEVMSMVLSTFDKELYEKDLKEEAFEEGYDQGYGQGLDTGAYQKLCSLIYKKLDKGLNEYEIADLLEEDITTVKNIVKEIKSSEK